MSAQKGLKPLNSKAQKGRKGKKMTFKELKSEIIAKAGLSKAEIKECSYYFEHIKSVERFCKAFSFDAITHQINSIRWCRAIFEARKGIK